MRFILTAVACCFALAFTPALASAQSGAIAGVVQDENGQPLYGMQVQVSQFQYATSGSNGRYKIIGLSPGTYTVKVIDGNRAVKEATVALRSGTRTVNVKLSAPAVPAGTVAENAARDLGYLNAERKANGLPAGIRQNTRWSIECAAHIDYLTENNIFEHTENPSQPGASAGGAWAGLSSIISEGFAWQPGTNPWENAPIHLDQLFAPSLSVAGLDDKNNLVAVTTFPGMVRTPGRKDTIYTYPGNGAKGIPPSEVASEGPFTAEQFVGIKAGSTTGRQMFVYLNQAHHVGQSAVTIVSAKMRTAAGQGVSVRSVNTTAKTVGPYLLGAVVIPVNPLSSATKYTVSVRVKDGRRTLSHTWSFTTAG